MVPSGPLRLVLEPLLEGTATEASREASTLAASMSWPIRRSRVSAATAVIAPAMTMATARNAVVDQLR